MITLPEISQAHAGKLAILKAIVLSIPLAIVMFTTGTELEQGFVLVPHLASGILVYSFLQTEIWRTIAVPVSRRFLKVMSIIAVLVYVWMSAIIVAWMLQATTFEDRVYHLSSLIFAANALYYLLSLLHKSRTHQELENYLYAYAVIPYISMFIAFAAMSQFNLQLNVIAFFFIVVNVSMPVAERMIAKGRSRISYE